MFPHAMYGLIRINRAEGLPGALAAEVGSKSMANEYFGDPDAIKLRVSADQIDGR